MKWKSGGRWAEVWHRAPEIPHLGQLLRWWFLTTGQRHFITNAAAHWHSKIILWRSNYWEGSKSHHFPVRCSVSWRLISKPRQSCGSCRHVIPTLCYGHQWKQGTHYDWFLGQEGPTSLLERVQELGLDLEIPKWHQTSCNTRPS